jgi:hypothetical protein
MKTSKWYQQQWLDSVRQLEKCQELLYWWHDAYPPREQLESTRQNLETQTKQWYDLYRNSKKAAR